MKWDLGLFRPHRLVLASLIQLTRSSHVSLSLSLRHYIVANQILGNRLRSRIGSLTNISHLHNSAWSLQLGASKPESSDDRKWRPTLEEPERERKRNNKEWDSWKRDFLKKKKRKKKRKKRDEGSCPTKWRRLVSKKKKIINEKDWGPERKKRVREKHANNGVVIIRLFQWPILSSRARKISGRRFLSLVHNEEATLSSLHRHLSYLSLQHIGICSKSHPALISTAKLEPGGGG